MGKKPTKFDEGIVVKTSTTAPSAEGEIRNKDSKLQTYIEGAERDIVTNDQTQTLENKTIDGTSATGNNTVTTDADQVTYDNATSGLTATNSQDAIDEVEARLDTAESNITTNASGLADHLADTTDAHDASAISNIPSGNLASTDVQSALNELQTDVDTRALDADLTAHISDTVDAHDASAISNVPSGNLVATDVQTALNELQTDIDTRALDTDLDAHVNNTTGAHEATAISYDNTTSGLLSTNVKTAIDELDNIIEVVDSNVTSVSDTIVDHIDETTGAHEATAISYDNTTSGLTAINVNTAIDEVEGRLDTAETNISTNASDLADHEALTSGVHGVTGSVVGTTDTQTLTNKTITGASIQSPTRLDAKKDTLANLETYALTATNGEILHATDTDQYFGVVDGALVPLGGGGAGSLSTFYTQDMEDLQDVSDFSTGNNASFAGGGTVAGTLALETTVEIAGDKSLKFTQASGSLNDYFMSEEITIENKQQGNIVGIRGYYEYDGDNGDFELIVYDETNDTVLIRETLNGTTQATKFEYNNIRIPSNCTSIRYGAQVAVENIGAILLIDDVEFNVDPRTIGQWVDVNSVSLVGSDGRSITANTESVPFGSGTAGTTENGWTFGADGSTPTTGNFYTKQRSDGVAELSGGYQVTSGSVIAKVIATLPDTTTETYQIGTTYSDDGSMEFFWTDAGRFPAGTKIAIIYATATAVGTDTERHYLNITETVNRRSITVEADNDVKSYTPTFQGFGTVTDINAFYSISDSGVVEIWGEATAGTVTADEAQISLPNGNVVKGSTSTMVAGVWGRNNSTTTNGGTTIITNGDSFINMSQANTWGNVATSPLVPAGGTAIVASGERFSWRASVPVQDTGLRKTIAITLDEIRADGQEYEVFGKFIWIGSTKYQVYRRSYVPSGGAENLDTLPTTLVILDSSLIGANYLINRDNNAGTGTEFTHLVYNSSTGSLDVQETTWTKNGVPQSFEYYDTARPLN